MAIFKMVFRSLDKPTLVLRPVKFVADNWTKAVNMALEQIEKRKPEHFELLKLSKLRFRNKNK